MQTPQPKLIFIWRKWAVAASVLFTISLAAYFLTQPKDSNVAFVEKLELIDPQLADYQKNLLATLNHQKNLIKSLNIAPTDYQDIFQQLEELESIIQQYQADSNQYGPNRKIIKALLKCAKQKIRLYEILLFEIDLNEHSKQLENEKQI